MMEKRGKTTYSSNSVILEVAKNWPKEKKRTSENKTEMVHVWDAFGRILGPLLGAKNGTKMETKTKTKLERQKGGSGGAK